MAGSAIAGADLELDVLEPALAPDQGESVGGLIGGFPSDGPQPPILPPADGFLFLEDRMIPPSARRQMAERTGATITEVPGSHAIYVSRPDAVARLITQAAQSVAAAASVA